MPPPGALSSHGEQLIAAAPCLAHPRPLAHCSGALEQLGWVDAHRGAGGTVVHAPHEWQAVAQVALNREAGRDVRGYRRLGWRRLASTHRRQHSTPQPRLTGVMSGHRIGPKERRVLHGLGLEALRVIESGRIDHRDVVIGTGDRAVAAANTFFILEIDLTLGPALDGAGGATVHAFRIVAMTAGGGNQVLAQLDAITNQTALAVQRFAGPDTIVAFHAQIKIHYQQGVGLDYPELAA